MSGKTAWVTLATNDSYCLGALVLANSLKRVNTVHQLVVLITKDVTQSMRQQLSSVFNVVKEVNVLDSGDEANLALMARPDLGITFTKLQCWNLTEYSKCVFLDADVLVIQNCDELFEREELSAAPDVGWPDCFNSGVFVFVPSKDTYKSLIDCALSQGSFDGGDQGLLNLYFRDWATKDIKSHLPFIYNMVSSATYSYLPAFKVFGSQVKIVHFIGANKPWLQSGATTSTLSSFLELWWNIFNSNVAKNLTSEMISNCTFDDVRWHNQLSSIQAHIPQQPHSHNHSYQQSNQHQHEPERHQFFDPWENMTAEQLQTMTVGQYTEISQSEQNRYASSSAENKKNSHIDIRTENPINLQQTMNIDIRPIGDERHNFQQWSERISRDVQAVDNSIKSIPAHHSSTTATSKSQFSTVYKTDFIPTEQTVHTQKSPQIYNSNTNYEHNKTNNSSNFEQIPQHEQSSTAHIPTLPVHNSMPRTVHPEPSQPVAMHSNQHPQTCFFMPHQETPKSNDGPDQQAGWAGVLAGGERSTIEEVWRRQNWEQGIIDYMGRDSFDNIWKKISESIGSRTVAASAAPIPAPAPASTEAPAEKPSEPQPPAPPAETKVTQEVPSQQPVPKEAGDASAPPTTEPPKTEQSDKTTEPPKEVPSAVTKTDAAPVTAEPPTGDKPPASEKTDSTPAADVPKTDVTSKPSETTEGTKAEAPKDAVDASKDKPQDLPKAEAPATPAQPSQPTEASLPQGDVAPKADEPAQPTAVVPSEGALPEKAAAPETPTEAKSESTPKDSAVKETAAEKTAEPIVSKQEVPTSEVPPPPVVAETPKTEAPKGDVPTTEAKPEEKKPEQPAPKEETVPKAEEVKPLQDAPKETTDTVEKKDDSAPKVPQTPPTEAPKDAKVETTPVVPPSSEVPKETPPAADSAPKPPSAPEAPKETAPSSTEKPAESAPVVPPTEPTASSETCTAVPASDAPADTPAQPGTPTEAKPSTEGKKPSGTPPSTPQTESAPSTAGAAAPVPPKRKGNKEQKSQNGGKQSKGKK